MLFPEAVWRINKQEKHIYLTFDDGPIPEITPWVLDVLDHYKIKATFFCVGDNVRKYPSVFKQVLDRGHAVGNHTFNHIQGIKTSSRQYLSNVELAEQYINSNLFRPPHGHILPAQLHLLKKKYRIIMWDVVTRDYSRKVTPEGVLTNVKKYTRNGSVIVFHDSLKAELNLRPVLPQAIEWLLKEGYIFQLIR
jgi:Predicted xylanase/chitin deacetylase